MVKERLRTVLHWIRQAITQPHHELDRWERAVRYVYDLFRHGAKQLRQDRAAQMAAALSYHTLFGLLPVFVLGSILLQSLGGFAAFKAMLAEVFGALGMDQVQVRAIAEDGDAEVSSTLSQWLLEFVDGIQHINLAAITWVGLLVLIYSGVGLMTTIETCFNTIYRAPTGRRWSRRIPIYWTILTLGPGMIAVSLYVDHRFDELLELAIGWKFALNAASIAWGFAATWLVMFVIYRLMPNTSVSSKAALIGAFVAAMLVEIGKRTMGAYLGNALSIRQLYGSLGLIPLFMFWVYVMWLMILFGLEVSAAVQMLRGRRLQELKRPEPVAPLTDPAVTLTVMTAIARSFENGEALHRRELSERIDVPEPTLEKILNCLVEERIIHCVNRGDQDAYTLARPPEQISAEKIIEVGFRLSDAGQGSRESPMLQRLREVQRRLAAKTTLAGLLHAEPALPAERKPNQA